MAKKEVMNKETGELVNAEYADMLDDLPSADSSDYRIPNLCIVQPTSKLPNKAGEIVDLNAKRVMAPEGGSIRFVPIWFYKSWDIFLERPNGERKYLGKEVFGPSNALWKWEEPHAEGKRKNMLNTNVFLILEDDLTSSMPQLYMFRFRGKSANEGKDLMTFWTTAKNYKQLPFSFVFSIAPTLVTDQKGKYYVAKLTKVIENEKHKTISGDALKVAAGWVNMVHKNLSAMTSAQLAAEDEVDAVDPITVQPLEHQAPVPQNQLAF